MISTFSVCVLLFIISCSIPQLSRQALLETPLAMLGFATATPTPMPRPTVVIPVLPTPVILQQELYRVRDIPAYSSSFAHPDNGCFWLGVAGQVFGADGSPQPKVVLVVEGILDRKAILAIGLTGTTDAYGTDSYEAVLGYLPVNSAQAVYITLYDLRGNQLSNPYRFNTYADCTRNLMRIDFVPATP